MSDHYILDGHTPVETDLMSWARWIESSPDRVVAKDEVGERTVSTVFIGLNHQFHKGAPPLLFETMVFGGEHDGYQARCATWDEAEAQHRVAVALVRGVGGAR